ncbi:hypothetical protein NLU13_7131 [Sarocladium strictum]|uniref:Beta-lactamase-related domain-containing protein n=1 Tax=Sarocladium strictum TaxID=5046 RepID=A0AA39GF17_SARSR|nr:hypothetical protein NLU13_7131 [Sarocladium strictum]
MDKFEATLADVTNPESGFMLGAIGLVVNNQGKILYHHAAGRQKLGDDTPINPNSTVSWTSVAKFPTHIAVMQFVERGLIKLDDPVEKHIPEMGKLPLIKKGDDGQFIISKPKRKMTIMDVLTHTCGIASEDHPLVESFLKSEHAAEIHEMIADKTRPLLRLICLPLIFEPGEGFMWGRSTYTFQYLVQKLGEQNFVLVIKELIFEPLQMGTATYLPHEAPATWERRLQMVEPEPETGKLVPCEENNRGFTCSMTDMAVLLADMLSPSGSKLLSQESMNLLLEPQLTPVQRESLRQNTDNFYFVTEHEPGPLILPPPEVNWTAGGLLYVEKELQRSGFPPGTVTWEGMGNVLFCLNKERGVAMLFGASFWPLKRHVNDVANLFMKCAWEAYPHA